jgi:hypothetical protein
MKENLTIEELIELRDSLVSKYIGEFKKPQSYFDKLNEIDSSISKINIESKEVNKL